MPTSVGKREREGLIRGFLGKLKFPQLFILLAALFAIDLMTPDPILLVDEAILGVLAVLLGMWRNRTAGEPEMKNITPPKQEN